MADRTDEILSTTLENYIGSGKLEDQIFDDFPLFYMMNKSGGRKVLEDGGYHIIVPVMYAANSTAQSYSGYDLLDTTPQVTAGNAKYNWKQYSVSITIDRRSERQNSGKHQIVNLLKGKIQQAEISLQQRFSEDLYSTGDDDSENIIGLQAICGNTPASASTIGGLNPATYSWWRNKSKSGAKSSTAFDNLISSMRNIYNSCSKGQDHPDIFVTNQTVFEGYEAQLTTDINYNVGMVDTKMVDLGWVSYKFRGANLFFDLDAPSGKMFVLNTKYLKLHVDKQSDFVSTPFIRPENQDARVSQILWMGELVCTNRSRQGVIYGIT